MAKSSPQIWIFFVLLAAFCDAAGAQAVTEYDGMAHRSATVARRGHHISDEINGVWRSLDGKVKGAPDNAGSQGTPRGATTRRAAVRSRAGAAEAPMNRKVYEDPDRIQPGMGYEELVRRFGPPSFEVSTGPGMKTVTYLGKGGSADLELQDGKVIKVATAKAQGKGGKRGLTPFFDPFFSLFSLSRAHAALF